MAQIISTIDKKIGNYEASFSYTMNVSFNGIEGNIDSAMIRFFVPDIIDINLDNLGKYVKNVTTEPVENGNIIMLDFGKIEHLGVALRFGFSASFSLDAIAGSTFVLEPSLWINDNLYQLYSSDEITLEVVPKFIIKEALVLPNTAPAPNGTVYYKVTLENIGDRFAKLENLFIDISPSENLRLDASYPIVGMDASRSFYSDTSQDGVLGTISENSIQFNVKEYRGERYSFLYRGILREDAVVGDVITTTTSFVADSIPKETATKSIEIGDARSDAFISLYGPTFTIPDSKINHALSIANTGNQILENASVVGTLSEDITYTSLKTGVFHIDVLEEPLGLTYELVYTTSDGQSGSLGTFNTDQSSRIDVPQNLSSIQMNFDRLEIGSMTKSAFQLDGIVKESVPLEITLEQSFGLTWDASEQDKVASKNTLVSDQSDLQPIARISPNNRIIRIGDTITYTIGANAVNSRLKNPTLSVLLPKELAYVGNIRMNMRQYFDAAAPILPEPTLIYDYNDASDTLLSFSFTDDFAHTFAQKDTIQISFDTNVKVGALGSFTSTVTLDATNASTTPTSKRFEQEVLFFAAVKSDKKVQGTLDSVFLEEPDVASTVAGATVFYLITIENTGNAVFDTIEIVDILPYVGDASVLNPSLPRKSEFRVFSLTDVIARKRENEEIFDYSLEYSNSTDPVRFGPSFNTIGTGDWNREVPFDASSIYAIRFRLDTMRLAPGEALQIGISAIASSDAMKSQVAWNSFAANISYIDNSGESMPLLAVEPEKVGVMINLPPEKDKKVYDIQTILKVNKSATNMVRDMIMNQMLLGMKLEDTIDMEI